MSKHLSPEFIAEMQQRLEKQKAELTSTISEHAHKEHGDFQADYPEYGRHEDENAAEIADFTATNEATEIEEDRLKDIEKALLRINNGTYGLTEDGEQIPEERLRANPAATTIVEPKS